MKRITRNGLLCVSFFLSIFATLPTVCNCAEDTGKSLAAILESRAESAKNGDLFRYMSLASGKRKQLAGDVFEFCCLRDQSRLKKALSVRFGPTAWERFREYPGKNGGNKGRASVLTFSPADLSNFSGMLGDDKSSRFPEGGNPLVPKAGGNWVLDLNGTETVNRSNFGLMHSARERLLLYSELTMPGPFFPSLSMSDISNTQASEKENLEVGFSGSSKGGVSGSSKMAFFVEIDSNKEFWNGGVVEHRIARSSFLVVVSRGKRRGMRLLCYGVENHRLFETNCLDFSFDLIVDSDGKRARIPLLGTDDINEHQRYVVGIAISHCIMPEFTARSRIAKVPAFLLPFFLRNRDKMFTPPSLYISSSIMCLSGRHVSRFSGCFSESMVDRENENTIVKNRDIYVGVDGEIIGSSYVCFSERKSSDVVSSNRRTSIMVTSVREANSIADLMKQYPW